MPLSPRDIVKDINRLVSFLLINGLAVSTNPAIIRRRHQKEIVTWSNAPSISELFRQPFASLPEYYFYLSNGLYNILLFDGSFFQFGYVFERGKLVRHRLLYYPCPIILETITGFGLAQGENTIGLLDLLLSEELELLSELISKAPSDRSNTSLRSRSPFRFDFYQRNLKHHSRSHLHVNDGECRWPVHAPLSIGHLIRFVFRNFYWDIWTRFEEIRRWPIVDGDRTISVADARELFLECVQ